jgi:hypothetical protein
VPAGSKEWYQVAPVWKDFFLKGGYVLNTNVNNPLYGHATGTGIYELNETATLRAVSNAGYRFTNWTSNGTLVSSANSFTFTVTGDATITANFSAQTFSVSAAANNPSYGSVTGGGDYLPQAEATLIATANQGYLFENWTNNGTVISTANPYTFTVTGDVSLIANFKNAVGVDITETSAISIYPNPVKEALFISSEKGLKRVEIADLAGRTLMTHNTPTINVSALPQGVYLVKIYTDHGVEVHKVVKE